MNSNELLLTAGGTIWVGTGGGGRSHGVLIPRCRVSLSGCSAVSSVVSPPEPRPISVCASFGFVSTRGPPDVSSLVPVGPKYTMKWSAPLQQVQVVEVGQEVSQSQDALFQQSGAKRAGPPGKISSLASLTSFSLRLRLIRFCSRVLVPVIEGVFVMTVTCSNVPGGWGRGYLGRER